MHILLSWSGGDSRRIAARLRDWLPSVLPEARPWMSTQDIAKGARWSAELARQLELADFGLVVVTPSNLTEPWVIFEAGAISKNLDAARVVPVLVEVDPSQLPPPLAQFQAARWSESELWAVVQSLNSALGAAALESAPLRRAFDSQIGELRVADISVAPPPPQPTKKVRKKTPQVSAVEANILLIAFEAPEVRGFESIDVDDVIEDLDLPRKKAEYHLQRLTSQGLLAEDGVNWSITHDGTDWLVRARRV